MEFKTLLMAQQSGWVMIGFLASRCTEIQKLALNSSTTEWWGHRRGLQGGLCRGLSCHSRRPLVGYLSCHYESSKNHTFRGSIFPKDVKSITERLSGHLFQGFMRSFHSKCSLACHTVKWWVWVKTCVYVCVSALDICIYLYICILFVQINVSSDVEYSRETQRRSWYNSKASEIFLNKSWSSDFWLIVNMSWRKKQHIRELRSVFIF